MDRVAEQGSASGLSQAIAVELKKTKISRRLVSAHIEPDPHHPGPANVRLREFGVPVWAIVGQSRSSANITIDQLASDYKIPRDFVLAALGYYKRYRQIIDGRLLANSEFTLVQRYPLPLIKDF